MFLQSRIRLPQTVVALSASALLLAGTAAFAQVTYDAQIPFSFSSPSLHSPDGVAVAPDGTVYATDIDTTTGKHGTTTTVSLVRIEPTAATVGGGSGHAASLAATGATLTYSGETTPSAVVVDSTGALYVADAGAGKVFKIASPESSTSPAATGISYGGADPTALAVDSANNLYIADEAAGGIYEVPSGGATGAAVSIGTGYEPVGLAVDSAGDIYFADAGTDAIYEYSVSAKGTSSFLSASGGTNFNFSGSHFVLPVGMGVDPAGDVYIMDSENGRIVEATSSINSFEVPISSINDPGSLALSSTGNIYLTDDSNEAVDEIFYNNNPVNFGSLPAGTASPEVTLNFYFVSAGSSVAYYQSVQGDSTGEFSNPGAGSYACRTKSYSSVPAGTVCSFVVEAKYLSGTPGLRSGVDGVSYASGTGTAYAGVPIEGIDLAGSLALYPGTQSVLSSSQTLYEPQALAVSGDGGWLFVADEGGSLNGSGQYTYSHPAVWGYQVNGTKPVGTPSNTASAVGEGTLGAGAFTSPIGLALDAAGNLYVADYSGYVRKIPSAGNWDTAGTDLVLPAGMLQHPISIAIDPSGNIYIGDAGPLGPMATASNPGWIVKVPADGGSAVKLSYTVNGTPVIYPEGLTTDIYGNLYIADGGDAENISNTGGVDMVTALAGVVSQTSAISAVDFGSYDYNGVKYSLNEPGSLSFDAAGDLYVLDSYNQRVLVLPISYSGTTPSPQSSNVSLLGYGASGISNLLVTPSSMVVWPGGQNITIADIGFTPSSGPSSPTQVVTLEAMNAAVDVSAGSGTLTGINVGNQAITFEAPTSAGTNQSYFSVDGSSGNCGTSGTTIGTGTVNACPIVIDLTKGVGTSHYSATFTMNGNPTDDYSALGNVITVSAEPEEPVAVISASGGFFAGSTITVTLSNIGADPLLISNLQLSNPSNAIISGGTCNSGVSVTISTPCTVTVAFDTGSYSYGTVVFTDNNENIGGSTQSECVYDFYGIYTGGSSGSCGGGGAFTATTGPTTTRIGGIGSLSVPSSGHNNFGGTLDSQGQTGTFGLPQGGSSSGDAVQQPASTIRTGNTPQTFGSDIPVGFIAPSFTTNDNSADDNSATDDGSSAANDDSTNSGSNGKKSHKSGNTNSGGNLNSNGSGDSAPQP